MDGWRTFAQMDTASHRTALGADERLPTTDREAERRASSAIRVSHSSQSKHRRSSVRRHRDDDDDSRNYFSSQRRGNRIHVWTAKAQQANKDREIDAWDDGRQGDEAKHAYK